MSAWHDAPEPWTVAGRAGGRKYGEAYVVDASGASLTASDGCFKDPDVAQLLVVAPALLAALRKIAAGSMPGHEEQAATSLVSWMRGVAIEAIDGLAPAERRMT